MASQNATSTRWATVIFSLILGLAFALIVLGVFKQAPQRGALARRLQEMFQGVTRGAIVEFEDGRLYAVSQVEADAVYLDTLGGAYVMVDLIKPLVRNDSKIKRVIKAGDRDYQAMAAMLAKSGPKRFHRAGHMKLAF